MTNYTDFHTIAYKKGLDVAVKCAQTENISEETINKWKTSFRAYMPEHIEVPTTSKQPSKEEVIGKINRLLEEITETLKWI